MIKFFTVLSGIFFLATGLSIGLFTLLFLFFTRQNPKPFSTQEWLILMFLAVTALGMIAFSIGLFVRKNWARVGVLIMSWFTVIVGCCIISVLIFPYMSNAHASLLFYCQGVIREIFLIALSLFFLVFFNAQPVKALFIRKSGDASS